MVDGQIGGIGFTIVALRNTGISVHRAAGLCVAAAGAVLLNDVRANVSMTTYTLDQLADMDHPYARRHGAINITHGGTSRGAGGRFVAGPSQRTRIRDEVDLVHTRSGAMLRSVFGRLETRSGTSGIKYTVGVDETVAPHVKDVILGTKVMLPRDVIWETAMAKTVQRDMMKAIVRVLGPALRTQAVVRFGAISKKEAGRGVFRTG